MQNLINKHVQLIATFSHYNSFYCGIFQLSDIGDDFIKLVPWDDAYQQSHKPWPTVQGEFHIRKMDIRGIVDLDTVNAKAIENYNKGIEPGSESQFPNNFS